MSLYEFLTPDFLKFVVPLGSAVIAWLVNEHTKRAAEDYLRKERKYESLIDSLQGFYSDVSDTPAGRELRTRFIAELNRCWLYCPDEVIRKAYAFLDSVTAGKAAADGVKEEALGSLMVAIRNDLLSRQPTKESSFHHKDFRNLAASGGTPAK